MTLLLSANNLKFNLLVSYPRGPLSLSLSLSLFDIVRPPNIVYRTKKAYPPNVGQSPDIVYTPDIVCPSNGRYPLDIAYTPGIVSTQHKELILFINLRLYIHPFIL